MRRLLALALAFGLAGRKLARQALEEIARGGRQSPDSARHLQVRHRPNGTCAPHPRLTLPAEAA